MLSMEPSTMVIVFSLLEITANFVSSFPKPKRAVLYDRLISFQGYLLGLKLAKKNHEYLNEFKTIALDKYNAIKNEKSGPFSFLKKKSAITIAELDFESSIHFLDESVAFWDELFKTESNHTGPSAFEVLLEEIKQKVNIDETERKSLLQFVSLQSRALGLS